jgi:naphtho-gamma-pyrone polyketide synthase
MVQEIKVYLFGDQTYDSNAKLTSLLLPTDNPILTSFFERSYHALRSEIGQLSSRERAQFPRFSSIADLLSRQREDGANPAIESALTTIYQLGSFIRSVQSHVVNSLRAFC